MPIADVELGSPESYSDLLPMCQLLMNYLLTSSSREKCTGFKDPTVFSKSGKGLRKKLKNTICSSPHAGFNGVFRISKLFFVLELFEFEVGKISKFFDLGGCLTSLLKKLGTSFEKLIFQKPLLIFPL